MMMDSDMDNTGNALGAGTRRLTSTTETELRTLIGERGSALAQEKYGRHFTKAEFRSSVKRLGELVEALPDDPVVETLAHVQAICRLASEAKPDEEKPDAGKAKPDLPRLDPGHAFMDSCVFSDLDGVLWQYLPGHGYPFRRVAQQPRDK